MTELASSPFSVINNEDKNVRNKFLGGQPHKNNFPGPFPGVNTGNNYMHNQQAAIQNYSNVSQEKLKKQNTPSCSNYDNYFADYGQTVTETFHDTNLSNPTNQSGFGKIIPEFKNPLFHPEDRPTHQFTHNNMVPYYGAKVTQNMRGTGVSQLGNNDNDQDYDTSPYRQKLAAYTGCDKEYAHKREVGNMFSPAERNTSWVFGAPTIRPDMDRYKESIWMRNGETPVEPIRVGPGIGIDYSNPAQGGFHQFNRILPNNVSNYKANQLEGRVNAGKWKINHPTSQFTEGVAKNRPDKVYTQARRPTMQSGFHTSAPSAATSGLTDYNITASKGKQNRSDTQQAGGFGQLSADGSCIEFSEAPIGMSMKASVPAHTQDRLSYQNIRPTLKKSKVKWVNGHYEVCHDDTQGANEWGVTLGGAVGGVNRSTTRDGYYANLTDRGDANPYVINVTGTAAGNQTWNPTSFTDPAKVTRKETLTFSHNGNIKGGVSHTSQSWDDNQKVTRKETTLFSHQGSIAGKPAHTSQSWEDNAKVTRKETTSFSHHGGAARGGAIPTDRFMFEGETTKIECFEDIIPDIDHEKWKNSGRNSTTHFRKGGMTSNGLRAATEVVNHFRGPGRTNILPDPTQNQPGFVSSIGNVQHNGIGGSISGPGTLLSANVQVGGGTGIQMQPSSFQQIGETLQNEKRSQFVDYRQTDPFIVENLRNNPLSIYAVGDAKNAEIPEFFVHTKPASYSSIGTSKNVQPDEFTKEMIIDGSPQSNILGLGDNNPLMGIKTVYHKEVQFPGKAYGGENYDSSIRKMYSPVWKGGHFGKNNHCTNKALKFASPGYQMVMGKFNHEGHDNNLPWKQIWNSSANPKENNYHQYFDTPMNTPVNNYKHGLPGTLVSN